MLEIYAILFLIYSAIWAALVIIATIAVVRVKIAKNMAYEDKIRRNFVRIAIVFISICLVLDIAMVLLNLMMSREVEILSCILLVVYLVVLHKLKD